MFVSQTGAYLSKAPEVALLQGRLLALPLNIRLGWKGLTGTHTVAYYGHLLFTDVKTFITLGPGPNVTKLLVSRIYESL
jgi:hypothetical protein